MGELEEEYLILGPIEFNRALNHLVRNVYFKFGYNGKQSVEVFHKM